MEVFQIRNTIPFDSPEHHLKYRCFFDQFEKIKYLLGLIYLGEDGKGCIDGLFCGQHENTNHLFIQCFYIKKIWDWISTFNEFTFVCLSIDVWIFTFNGFIFPFYSVLLDASIFFKDKLLVELIRVVVLQTMWLEHSNYVVRT